MIAEKLTIDRLFLKTLQIPWQSSMRIFLGVLMVVMVSGDDTTVVAVLEESVLLPCTCLELDDGFKWQMEEPNRMLVYKSNKPVLNRYKDRTKKLSNDSNNCSVLLTNITAEDQGKYNCIFHSKGTYQDSIVYLNVSARFRGGKPDKILGNSNSTQRVRIWLGIIPMVMFGLSLLFLFSKYRSSQRGLRK